MENENSQIWQSVLGRLELTISKPSFATWFKGTNIIEKTDSRVVVGVPNGFSKEWLKNKYHDDILKGVRSVCPEVRDIEYKIISMNNGASVGAGTVAREPMAMSQVETKIASPVINGLNPKYTFQNFIVGGNNELAAAACQAVAKKPGSVYNPLFIYGGVGLGKTHLMQAVGNEILSQNSKARVLYVSSERFTNDFVSAIEQGRIAAFKELYRKVDVLLVDDIQFIAGKERSQEEFFHTFNELHQNNKQVILSSDRLPKEIPSIEERLVSRFEWGMVADVGSPDLETRIAILKAKAKEKNYEVPPEVILYIAESVKSNIRELEGALNRLMVFCELNGVRANLDQAKSILSVTAPRKKSLNQQKLAESVAAYYNVTLEDLIKQSRKKEFVKPRQIAMYLIRQELESSFPSIGEFFGGRDHTTVMHAVEKIDKLKQEKDMLKQELDIILEKAYN
jgi:chromosomal replication initiator protein